MTNTLWVSYLNRIASMVDARNGNHNATLCQQTINNGKCIELILIYFPINFQLVERDERDCSCKSTLASSSSISPEKFSIEKLHFSLLEMKKTKECKRTLHTLLSPEKKKEPLVSMELEQIFCCCCISFVRRANRSKLHSVLTLN